MILCCGEALIDMIPTQTTEGTSAFVPYAGGAVFNTAIALGRLGAPTGFFSGLSSDLFGQQLAATLHESHVDTSLITPVARPTTLAFVQLVDGHARYAFYDENTAGRLLNPTDLPTVPDSVTALYFGGISLVSEPAAESYAILCDSFAGDRATMIDPNIRPDFIETAASYRARLDRMCAKADIVKVSDEDLAWLSPDSHEADAIQDLLDKGPAIVIVTRGAKGAEAHRHGHEAIFVPSTPVTVVDTVGAGDTYNAGFLAHLSAHNSLTKSALRSLSTDMITDAMAMGAKAAAVTVSRAGANPPWKDELTTP